MKRVNVHKPDTCECVLVYEWDDQVPAEDRVHVPLDQYFNDRGELFKTFRCPAHQVEDLYEHHAAVIAENQKKNLVVNKFKDQFQKEVAWGFDKDRNLEVAVENLSAEQKIEAKALVEEHFPEHQETINLI